MTAASSISSGTYSRRIIALENSCSRRRRRDKVLRRVLATKRKELALLEESRDSKVRQVQQATDALRVHKERIDTMMTGTDAFSLDILNEFLLYLDILIERLRSCEADLSQTNAAVHASANAVALAIREIAVNLNRIDICSDCIRSMRREQDIAANEVCDEEAEENALARRFQERRAST